MRLTLFPLLPLLLILLGAGLFLPPARPALSAPPAGEVTRPAMVLPADPDPRSPTGVAIPRDLEAALDELDRVVPAGWKEGFRALPEEAHREAEADLGRWIKANWGLYQDTLLTRWFQNAGVFLPDEMGGVTLLAFWRRLNGAPYPLEGLLASYGIRTLPASELPAVEIGQGKKKETLHRFTGWGYSLDLPPWARIRVREGDPRNGFSLVSFHGRGERQLLAVYSGPHPSYPALVPGRVRIRKGTIAGRPAEWSEWKLNGLHHREVMLELKGESPPWLHLWYHGLDGGERKDAERLLSRLLPSQPPPGQEAGPR